jgi:hypothetical protein
VETVLIPPMPDEDDDDDEDEPEAPRGQDGVARPHGG